MRNDLPSLNAGKAMAQAAHAANDFVSSWKHLSKVKEWEKEGGTYGTTIVLAVDKKTLLEKMDRVHLRDGSVPFGLIYDSTYPYIVDREIAELIAIKTAPPIVKEDGRVVLFRNELTCGYIFVADGSTDQQELVGDLQLHP